MIEYSVKLFVLLVHSRTKDQTAEVSAPQR